jgi:hypothetical protein
LLERDGSPKVETRNVFAPESIPVMTVPTQLADMARSIMESLTHTDYQYSEHIVPSSGVYDCDCNAFVGFILQSVAPAHYALITPEADEPRPRAFVYYDFFAALTPQTPGRWRRIDFVSDARPGDIVAWRSPTIEIGQDTGHVMIVAAAPTVDASGVFSLPVYDSADLPHFDDTRGTGPGKFANGVGGGTIKLNVDGAGRPVAFVFSPSAKLTFLQIAIGRAV